MQKRRFFFTAKKRMPVCRRPKSLQSAGGYAIIFSYFIIEEGLHVIGRNQTTQTAKQTLPKRTRRHLQRYAADGRQMGERGDHAQDGSFGVSVQLFGLEISDFTNELADPEMVAALRKHVPLDKGRAAETPHCKRIAASEAAVQEFEAVREESALTVSVPTETPTEADTAALSAARSAAWRFFTVIVTIALAVGALCMGIAAFSAGIVVFTDNLGDVAANNYGYDFSDFVTFLVCAVIFAAAAVIAPFAARRLAKKRTRRADESFVGQPV